MKILTVLASIFVLCVNTLNVEDLHLKQEWSDFKIKFNRTYGNSSEEQKRFEVFETNFEKIKAHNELYDVGKESFKLGINRYGDLTYPEIVQIHTPNKTDDDFFISSDYKIHLPKLFRFDKSFKAPESVDWRQNGAVTSVKDQLPCGSCWAFASVSCIESQYFIKTGKIVDLSEQQLVDCVTENFGCDGGDATLTYTYLMNNNMSLEQDYPYQVKQNKCNEASRKIDLRIEGFAKLQTNDEETLKQAIARVGPIEVSISFVHEKFMRYAEGIYFDLECDDGMTNHAVSVVGYGTDVKTKMDYWIVKNSWAPQWGEEGFIRIARNKDNHCGIASHGMFPFLNASESLFYVEEETPQEKGFFSTPMVLGIICIASLTIFIVIAYLLLNLKEDDNSSENELTEFVDLNEKSENFV